MAEERVLIQVEDDGLVDSGGTVDTHAGRLEQKKTER